MAKVIVKFLTGEERRGDILFFNINQPTFPFQIETEKGTEMQTVSLDSVKAVLFLKKEDLGSSQIRTETINLSKFAGTLAYKLVVEFKDGQIINGSTNRYNPNDKGFFLVPINPADKSDRIYVNAQAVNHVDCRRLLGRILCDQKKINSEQLEEALRHQKEQRDKKIGAILKEKAIITEKQLRESLERQKEKPKLLGQILLEAGYITSEQLQYAIRIQEENRKKKLGQILVELKYLTPSDICIALATQFNLPWIDLSSVKIPAEIATSIPEEVERRLEVIPVERKGENTLAVATSQPQDPDILSELNKYTKFAIELVIAYEVYIAEAINYYFHKKE